jgi:hypothetical protein
MAFHKLIDENACRLVMNKSIAGFDLNFEGPNTRR